MRFISFSASAHFVPASWAIALSYIISNDHETISAHTARSDASSDQATLARTAFIASMLYAVWVVLGCSAEDHRSSTRSQNSKMSFLVSASSSGSNLFAAGNASFRRVKGIMLADTQLGEGRGAEAGTGRAATSKPRSPRVSCMGGVRGTPQQRP